MDPPASINELISQSRAKEMVGDLAAALELAEQALAAARVAGAAEGIAASLVCLATVHFRLGHYDRAREQATEALAHVGETPLRAQALLLLGMCATETDNLARGEDYYRQAIDLSRQVGDVRTLVRALHDMAAGLYMPRGQFDLSLSADQEALHLARQHKMSELLQFPLVTMAWVLWRTGRRTQAWAVLDELSRELVPGSATEGYYYCIRGDLTQDEGALQEALGYYERARLLAETTGDPGLNVLVRLGLSRCRYAVGDLAAARDWAGDALAVATRLGYRHAQIMALIERGRTSAHLSLSGDLSSQENLSRSAEGPAYTAADTAGLTAAEADLLAAVELARTLGATFDLARAQLLLASVLRGQGRPGADQAWREASRLIRENGYAFLLDQERWAAFALLEAYLNHPDPTLAEGCTVLLEQMCSVPPAPLRILALGRFEVWCGARRVEPSALRRRQADRLLGLLLLTPSHSLAFDEVAEALWPDKSLAAAQTAFHHATSALRRALEPDLPDKFPSRYLKVEEGRISLQLPPGSSVDFEEFSAHCRRRAWSSALSLYGGDLFPDFIYDDWTIMARQQLLLRYQAALLAAAEEHLEHGRAHEALDACLRLLALEPWHEQAVLVGMHACLALHDRTGALRLYRNLEQALRTELGIAPQAEVQALYHSLIRPDSNA